VDLVTGGSDDVEADPVADAVTCGNAVRRTPGSDLIGLPG